MMTADTNTPPPPAAEGPGEADIARLARLREQGAPVADIAQELVGDAARI